MLLWMLRRRVAQPIDQSRNSSRDKTISRPSLVVAQRYAWRPHETAGDRRRDRSRAAIKLHI